MDWLILVIGMKYSEGFTRVWPMVVMAFFMLMSIGCLGIAVKTIPAGTAYAVWTGGSVVAVTVVGVYVFGEPTTSWRLACILFIIIGIMGLRLGTNN